MRLPKLLTVLDRYLFEQLALTILFALILFSVIWLAPEILFKLIQNVSSGKLPGLAATEMFFYHLPAVFQQSIPMASLLGSLFLFRRLSLNYELVAIYGSGITPLQSLRPVLLVGIMFSLLSLYVQEAINPITSPRLTHMYSDFKIKTIKNVNFTFVEKNRQGQLDKFFLIGETANQQLKDFIILYYKNTEQGGVQISRILRAPNGKWNGKVWQLFNGIDYELDDEGVYREIRPFQEQWVNTSKYPVLLLKYAHSNPEDMSYRDLRRYIKLLYEGGQLEDVHRYELRLAQKLAFPATVIIFTLLGALLGVEKIRSHKNYGLLCGALIVFLYIILVSTAANLGAMGLLPALLLAWLPLALTILAAIGILKLRKAYF